MPTVEIGNGKPTDIDEFSFRKGIFGYIISETKLITCAHCLMQDNVFSFTTQRIRTCEETQNIIDVSIHSWFDTIPPTDNNKIDTDETIEFNSKLQGKCW